MAELRDPELQRIVGELRSRYDLTHINDDDDVDDDHGDVDDDDKSGGATRTSGVDRSPQ
jgi:hypothetical protein